MPAEPQSGIYKSSEVTAGCVRKRAKQQFSSPDDDNLFHSGSKRISWSQPGLHPSNHPLIHPSTRSGRKDLACSSFFLKCNTSRSSEKFSEMKAVFSVFCPLPSSSVNYLSVNYTLWLQKGIDPFWLFPVCVCLCLSEESQLIKITCFKGAQIARHRPPGPVCRCR